MSDEKTIVLQNYRPWLAPTENWIYNQVRFLPPSVKSHVVCARILNPDQFAWPQTISYATMAKARRLLVQARGIVGLGSAYRRHAALLCHAARATGARIVHSHFGFTGAAYARAVRRMGLRHVVTFYGVDASMLPRSNPEWVRRYQEMFPLVDRVLCEGPHLAQAIVALGCPQEKTIVHHLGVPLAELPFVPRSWVPGEPLRVLIAATFREKKGIPYALEALGLLKAELPLRITLIGDANSTPESQREKEAILRVIAKYGLGSLIELPGYQTHDELMRLAYEHHVFLSPSVTGGDGDSEGGAPVAITEMAATGMPIVATRHADIPEVIEDGVGGLLADERDVDGLVEHLRWLIRYPERWPEMLAAARSRIEHGWSAVTQGERLAEIYRSLLGERVEDHHEK